MFGSFGAYDSVNASLLCGVQVGAAIEPNPGECFLEQREVDGRTVYDYTKDRVYVRMYTRNSIGELHTK